MNHPVVMAAEHHEVPELGVAAIDPVADVVGVAHHRGPVTAREGAVDVASE
jgi:hypothetical protein